MWYLGELGATLARQGTRREIASMSATLKSSSASRAAASRCSTVLVEPPIATSSATAFSNALREAIERGRTEASSFSYHCLAMSTTSRPARSKSARRAAWVARVEPLPGRARPIASVRQFIELAVNMPEHEPQVGHADRSMSPSCASVTASLDEAIIASMRSILSWTMPSMATVLPASIGPPETKTVGMLSRSAAISMPGVILSQLEMQTSASAQCAFTMYSTASAISSRLGSE
jgi:hypothetical protein